MENKEELSREILAVHDLPELRYPDQFFPGTP